MTTSTYTLFNNVDRYRDSDNVWGEYRPGNRLARYYQNTTEVTHYDTEHGYVGALWELFQVHNRDSRPCGRLGPSLSIGDVIVFGDDPEALSTVEAFTLTHDGEWVSVNWNEAGRDVLVHEYLAFVALERASR